MARAALGTLLRYLCRLNDSPTPEAADGDLLRRYAAGEEAAFAALLRRHAPLVWGVCRRLLGDDHDAEDAFQAAFLVLVRKAGSLRRPQSLAGFLHAVAYRVARKARVTAARRRRYETRAEPPRSDDPLAAVEQRDLRALLDEELDRLPEKYRAPLVLCYLEGLTYDEAARRLGWRDGTVCGRLARAREMLRQRLGRRGLTLTAAALTAALAETANAPAASLAAVRRMAELFALGEAITDAVSTPAATLAQGLLHTMTVARLKMALAVMLALSVLAGGASWAVHRVLAEKPAAPNRAEETRAAKTEAVKQVRKDAYGDPLPAGAVARLGTLRFRHEGEAWSLAFSPDDKILASTSHDGLIYLWDAATGKELRRIRTTEAKKEYISHVFALAFSPDGKVLASRQTDNAVCLWDVATGKELRRIAINNGAPKEEGALCFSPDGKALAFDLMALLPPREFKHRVLLLDAATGKEHCHLDFKNGVRFHNFSPDGKAVAVTVGIEPGVQLWDAAAGKLIRKLKAETFRMAFSPDGKLLASAGDKRIVFTDVKTGEEIGRMEAKMDLAMSLAFTPDGKTLLSGNQDGKVRVWDVATKKLRRELDAHMWMIRDMALSHDGKTVAVGTVYNTIRLWDVASGKEMFEEHQGHDAQVNAVAFSPDGKMLASGGDNQQIRLWDAAGGKPIRRIKSSARAIAFAPDGKRLASIWTYNNTARLWDTATGKETLLLPHEGIKSANVETTLRGLAFSSDGRNVFTVDHQRSGQAKSRLHVWDAATGRHLREFDIAGIQPECLAVAPNGKTVALGGHNEALQVWDLESGKLIHSFAGHQHSVEAVAFSPDGRTLASGSLDQTVRLWETATGKPIRTLRGHERSVTALAFGPDGRFLASGSGATHYPRNGRGPHKIRVWDVLTGREVFHFQGHGSNVTSLAFAPDGSRLASGLRNSSVLIWDASALTRLTSPTKEVADDELSHLWTDLTGADAARAYEAMARLAATPKQAVALLKSRLKPAAAIDEKQLHRLISDLDSGKFAVREAASRELEQRGAEAEPALRRALADRPSLETRRRLEPLLTAAHMLRSPEAIAQVRAVQVLERIGTAEARQVLEKLATGAPAARQTREAKASLQRLDASKSPRR
ncbi:MAG TPA: sigma-70 family RNA polymerase sigma factor [Gemmataceae bacterium]|jgi:RNA polymerase sigma factor (sigma-70 family)